MTRDVLIERGGLGGEEREIGLVLVFLGICDSL